jgi:hypothetical protein
MPFSTTVMIVGQAASIFGFLQELGIRASNPSLSVWAQRECER